jgi:hypothetical protein
LSYGIGNRSGIIYRFDVAFSFDVTRRLYVTFNLGITCSLGFYDNSRIVFSFGNTSGFSVVSIGCPFDFRSKILLSDFSRIDSITFCVDQKYMLRHF